MSEPNRHGLQRRIKEETKRAVRKRCQFGCVVCGSAIVQYHHFDPPFEAATEHKAEGITLLCGGHHNEATVGLLSEETVRRHNAKPYCASHPPKHLLDLADPIRIVAGGAVFVGTGPLILVDDVPLFEIVMRDGMACVNARFTDESGRTVIEIQENELLVREGLWDATFVGTRFVVRSAPGEIAFECIVHPPHGLFIRRIDFSRPPYRVVSDEAGFNLFNQNGQSTELERGYVWVLGGPITMAEGKFELNQSCASPYPVDRFMRRAREGEIARLVGEVLAPQIRVEPPTEQRLGWAVVARGTELSPSAGPTEENALALARGLARAGAGRVIHVHANGAFNCLFED